MFLKIIKVIGGGSKKKVVASSGVDVQCFNCQGEFKFKPTREGIVITNCPLCGVELAFDINKWKGE